jgi:hypothetical protein
MHEEEGNERAKNVGEINHVAEDGVDSRSYTTSSRLHVPTETPMYKCAYIHTSYRVKQNAGSEAETEAEAMNLFCKTK